MTFRPAGGLIGAERDVLLAATPEEMRGLLDNFTNEVIRGNISPEAGRSGISAIQEAARSPNATARQIRNVLKNPLARTLLDNPDIAEGLAKSSVGMLDQFGINSGAAKGYIGPGMDLLRQAKKDGILKPDVTDKEVAREIQRPLYQATQGWLKDMGSNRALDTALTRDLEEYNKPKWGDKRLPTQRAFMLDAFPLKGEDTYNKTWWMLK